MTDCSREYYVIWNDDDATLTITITGEGVIADLFAQDENGEDVHIGTWARAADELLDLIKDEDR